jgi:hypothetical protein
MPAKILAMKDFFVNDAHVEVSPTRGTTALVYCLINTVAAYMQVLYKGDRVHPNWLDGQ